MLDSPSTTTPTTAPTVPAHQGTRTERYLARLSKTLSELDPVQQRMLLSNEFVKWTARYERFVAESWRETPPRTLASPDGPDAADFICTITAIASRIAAFDATAGAI